MKFMYNLFLLSILLLCCNQKKVSISKKQNPPQLISYKGAKASQSSTFYDCPPENALKDDKSDSITFGGYGNWWKVSLPKLYRIQKIYIRNIITDGCLDCALRLTGAKVFVGNKRVYTIPESHSGQIFNIKVKGIVADEIKIVSTRSNSLSLQAVLLYGEEAVPIDYKGAKASQSSTFYDCPPENALKDDKSDSITFGGYGNWWKVSLPKLYRIQKIIIKNIFTDGCIDCALRLTGAKVFVGNKHIYTLPKSHSSQIFDIKVKGIVADEIKIVSAKSDSLSLQAVLLYGNEENPIDLKGAKASQSSTLNNGIAQNALINNNDKIMTKKGKDNWWRVKFPKHYKIQKIRIQGRMDCCNESFAGAKVYANGKHIYTIPKGKIGQWFTIDGRKIVTDEIRIVLPKNDHLSFSRIQVYGEEVIGQLISSRFQATNSGKWLNLVFPKNHKFRTIRIKNKLIRCSSPDCKKGLAGAQLQVGNYFSYNFPEKKRGKWYEIELTEVSDKIKIRLPFTPISKTRISKIQFFEDAGNSMEA